MAGGGAARIVSNAAQIASPSWRERTTYSFRPRISSGREPPSRYAEHTRSGFAVGHWEGNTLVTRTTHMKASFIRKNGPPSSDRATMTNRFYRHGNYLTLVAVIEDPIYLSEPLIWTRDFQVSPTRLTPEKVE